MSANKKSGPFPDRSVYLRTTRALLPRWLRHIGSAPWIADDFHTDQTKFEHPKVQYQRQAATLATALLYEIERDTNDREYVCECIRASLVRWQLSLRSDGVPISSKWRQSPWHGMAAFQVIQLLREVADFQTPQLLKDIKLHVRWLLRRPPEAPWLEANIITAIAESAPLIRDTDILTLARIRLFRFLKRQDEEGWFPERGGVDIGRHSMTIDVLARLYRFHRWGELEKPLHRDVQFLTHLVQPNGSKGGCFGTCETAFLCPYGLELLSLRFAEAAGLALHCRQYLDNMDSIGLTSWSDDLQITLGTSIALAATHAPPTLSSDTKAVTHTYKHIHFTNAGLSIHQTEHYHAIVSGYKGGCLQVTWKKTGKVTEDQGIMVTYPQHVRISGRNDPRINLQVSETEVSCRGILRRLKPSRIRWNQWLKRLAQRLVILYRSQATRSETEARANADRRIASKRFTRIITFGRDWIRIVDHIHSRPRCETIICQIPHPERQSLLTDPAAQYHHQPPIFLEGGREVAITRLYRNGRLVDRQQTHAT